jgi:hypothetical protein
VQHGRFVCPLCIPFALVRYTLLLVQLLTFTAFVPNNEHDIQQNTALAIVRTSAPRETPMALKLSAAIVIVESERNLPLLLGLTHRPFIFALPFRVYPLTTQMPCSVHVHFCSAGLRTFHLRPW